jgi:hypothetical protein
MMLGAVSRAKGENERARKPFQETLSLAEPIGLSRVMQVAQREMEKLLNKE